MAGEGPKDERLGTSREFELRDDDRPDDAPYGRKRPLGTGLLVLFALGLIIALGLYLHYAGTGHPTGASVPVR